MRRSVGDVIADVAAMLIVLLAASSIVLASPRRSCPPEGDGGDPDLNALKNRTDVPQSLVQMSVSEIRHLTAVGSKAARSTWSESDLAPVRRLEATAVQVRGYLIAARVEGPESANCHSATDQDMHLLLVDLPDDSRSRAIVAEVTPHRHPTSWTEGRLRGLARNRSRVRVSGWLMYDQEHAADRTFRGTAWEVHPVTSIEVVGSDGQWSQL